MTTNTTAISPLARRYLQTLRQIPADIMLAMGTREFEMNNGNACLCGWAIREAFARDNPLLAPEEINAFTPGNPFYWAPDSPANRCWQKFNGVSRHQWRDLYEGADTDTVHVEEAFAIAFAEAAEGRKLVK